MRIVSFQSQETTQRLENDAPLFFDESVIPDDWRHAYEWMNNQMTARISPPPVRDTRLMWGWPLKCVPLNDISHSEDDKSLYRIEMDIPENEILISDFNAWHCVLAGRYLASDEDDDIQFSEAHPNRKLSRLSADPRPYQAGIARSWDRIFKPEDLCTDYWGSPEDRIYQACFWPPASTSIRSINPVFKTHAFPPGLITR